MLRELQVVGQRQRGSNGHVIDGYLVDNADVDDAVVEACGGGDGHAVADAVAVLQGDDPCVAFERASVEVQRVVRLAVVVVGAEHDVGVSGEAACFGDLHQARHMGVEAHTGGADTDIVSAAGLFAADEDGIDGEFVLLVECADGEPGLHGKFEGIGQSVAGTAGNDAEGDVAAAQTLYDIVDRAVAAHGDDTVVALHGCFACQLGAVVYALCVLHLVVEEVVVEVLFQQALNLLLLADTRDGVDYK